MAMQGYGTFDPNIPPELAAEQQRIARQQAIADAMVKRGMASLPTNQGPISWTQGIAKLLQAKQGRSDIEAVEASQAQLGQRYNQMLGDEVSRIQKIRQGTPTTETIVDEQANDGEGAPAQIVTPARGDPRAAVQAAMESRILPPSMKQFAVAEYAHMKKGDEPYTLKPGDARFGPDGKLINFSPEKTPIEKAFKQGDIRKFLDGGQEVTQEYQADGTWKEMARGSRKEGGSSVTVSAPVTPVTVQDPNDPNKTIVVDGRSGRKIGDGPKLSETGKSNAKRQIAAQGTQEAIDRARALLTGAGGQELPTSSGIGAAVDTAASIFGMTPAGAKTADQLKVAGGALVSKVPRFEGPQSDKDVAHYKEVAGRIGDPTMPIARRLAALEEVERIWGEFEAGKKYGFFQVSGPGGAPKQGTPTLPDQPPPGAVRRRGG